MFLVYEYMYICTHMRAQKETERETVSQSDRQTNRQTDRGKGAMQSNRGRNRNDGGVPMQAIDRLHRIGQTKPITAIRFIIKDSIEERIVELQVDTRKHVASMLVRTRARARTHTHTHTHTLNSHLDTYTSTRARNRTPCLRVRAHTSVCLGGKGAFIVGAWWVGGRVWNSVWP